MGDESAARTPLLPAEDSGRGEGRGGGSAANSADDRTRSRFGMIPHLHEVAGVMSGSILQEWRGGHRPEEKQHGQYQH